MEMTSQKRRDVNVSLSVLTFCLLDHVYVQGSNIKLHPDNSVIAWDQILILSFTLFQLFGLILNTKYDYMTRSPLSSTTGISFISLS